MKKFVSSATAIAAIALTSQAQANDTNGPYAGLSFGTMTISAPGFGSDSASGAGLFVGFNGELSGKTVISGEFEAAKIEDVNTYNLKARIGYDLGQKATVFGFVGLGILSGPGFTESENIYGIAADFAASSNVLVGVEGLKYTVSGGSLSTVKARVAYKF